MKKSTTAVHIKSCTQGTCFFIPQTCENVPHFCHVITSDQQLHQYASCGEAVDSNTKPFKKVIYWYSWWVL